MSKPGVLWRAAAAWDVFRGRPAQTRSIFAGAAQDRLNSAWLTSCLAPDEEIKGDLRLMRGRSRQLCRDSAFAERYLELLVDNVYGSGIRLLAQYRDRADNLDKALNTEVEGAWSDYCRGPVTVDGKHDFAALSALALESVAKEGEIFPRRYRNVGTYGLAVQMIDPDLVDELYSTRNGPNGNEVRLGVEVSPGGRPLGYWVREDPRYGWTSGSGRLRRVDASDVWHIGRSRRANQTRYFTWFHAVMEDLHQISSYIESELMASRLASNACGVWVDKQAPEIGTDGGSKAQTTQRLEAEPGMFLDAPAGKELQSWAPGHPTDAFPEFIKSGIRRVASGLGVSYASLANDVSDASYSNERTGLLKERDRWMNLQDWWISAWQRPFFNAWLGEAVLRRILPPEVLPADGRQPPIEWAPRRWPWVDPLNDAQARILALRHNLTSHQRIHAELGTDLEEILEQRQKAQELAEQYDVDLEPTEDVEAPAGTRDEEGKPTANGNGNGNGAKAKPARSPRSRLPADA